MKKDYLNSIAEAYDNAYKDATFVNRYVVVDDFHRYITSKYKSICTEIGQSFLGKPIYKVRIGSGKTKILAWTQMHGNESTGTLASLDLIKFLSSNSELSHSILEECTLDIILMLNPDGAEEWKRRTAIEVDMNRDFNAEQTVEIKVLKECFSSDVYDLCLNIHDQRTVFTVGNSRNPATLSFLSPAVDEQKTVTKNREISMGMIAAIYDDLSSFIPNQMDRFSDEYYPNSTGDNFQKLVPTILFEAGHYPMDYNRSEVRKYLFLSFVSLLNSLSTQEIRINSAEKYSKIPFNTTNAYDVVVRNVTIVNKSKKTIVDVAIQYKEELDLELNSLKFIPYIEEIGDLSDKFGYLDVDLDSDGLQYSDKLTIGQNAEDLLIVTNVNN